jgi:hypothetical protein
MSLQPTSVDQLSAIMTRLSSSDNALRTQSERDFHVQWLKAQPDQVLLGLTALIQQHPDSAVCSV